MDKREGREFLRRWLLGPQNVWETIDAKLNEVPKLWSVTECPDEYLKFLKWIVGWTPELDNITSQLGFDELRRLISISGRLWKQRGTESTIIDVMFFATSARCRIWNWFDFRWVLGVNAFDETRESESSWLLPLPDPSVWGVGSRKPERTSVLRIVDDGALNRTLVLNLLRLMRGNGERWEVVYLSLLDLFIIAGDDTQWTKADAESLVVAGGVMSLGSLVTDQWTDCIPELGLLQGAYTARVRIANESEELGFYFYDDTSNPLYYLGVYPTFPGYNAYVYLMRWVGGSGEGLFDLELPNFPIFLDFYYTYRLTMADEIDGRVRLQLFIDGNEIFNVVDDQFVPEGGGGGGTVVWTEEQPAGPGPQSWNGVNVGGDTSPVILAAADGGRLWKGSLLGLIISWSQVYPHGDSNASYFSCAVGYDGLTMLESLYSDVPTRSLDGGGTWGSLPTFPAGAANWSVAIGGDNLTFLAVAFGQTPQVSNDAGSSWTNTPIAGLYGVAWNGGAVGRNPLVMAAVMASRAYFTTDGWSTYQELRPLGDVDSYWGAVSIAGDDQTILLVSYDTPGIIYATRDRGLSGWTAIDTGATDLDCVALGADGLLALYGVYDGVLERTNNVQASMEDLGSFAWSEITSPFGGGGG